MTFTSVTTVLQIEHRLKLPFLGTQETTASFSLGPTPIAATTSDIVFPLTHALASAGVMAFKSGLRLGTAAVSCLVHLHLGLPSELTQSQQPASS